MKQFFRSLCFVFFLTAFTVIETTDLTVVNIERLPSVFLGCLSTVIIKFYIVPYLMKLKNKSNDSSNQNKQDN